MNILTNNLIKVISIIIASTTHEFAHAFTADKLGDPTPKMNNRLTINPFAHIDPIGAISLWIFGFGWSKPVPVNSYNFKNSKLGIILVSAAGPISNIILAILSGVIVRIIPNLINILIPFITINCALALFNFIPIPPLDGSKILFSLLPSKIQTNLFEFEKMGPIIILLLITPYSPLYQVFSTYMIGGLNILIELILFSFY